MLRGLASCSLDRALGLTAGLATATLAATLVGLVAGVSATWIGAAVAMGWSSQVLGLVAWRRSWVPRLVRLENASASSGELVGDPQAYGPWSEFALSQLRVHRLLAEARADAQMFRLDRDQIRRRAHRAQQRLLDDLGPSTMCAAAMVQLLSDSPLTPEQRRYAECTRAALDSQLLRIRRARSRVRARDFDNDVMADVRRCVEHVVEFYAHRAETLGCPLLLSYGPLPARARSLDALSFRQVLFGLVRRAMAMAIGPVRIEVAVRHPPSPHQLGVRIQVTATPDAHRTAAATLACVAPNRGAFEALPTSFDLATTRRIVTDMGGELELDRGVLDGTTTFYLLVPCDSSAAEAANVGEYVTESASGDEIAPAANDAGPTRARDQAAGEPAI
ncbi:MAG: hypothetical protein B7733_08870 [Myxococcales bacterium FL481]|nr:MAG: hypothetical protein B7733_08870 [Myxococcales bacterium FL481]